MTALQLGNTVAGSGSVDIGKRAALFRIFGVTTGAVALGLTGCATLPPEVVVRNIMLGKKLKFSKRNAKPTDKPDDMPLNIKVTGPDPITGNFHVIHPKLVLLTTNQLEVTARGELVTTGVKIDIDSFWITVADKEYGIKLGDQLQANEIEGIIYIENITAKNRKAT